MGNGCGGGGLGGECSSDCVRDLRLKGRGGGGGFSHLKKEGKKLWPGVGVGGGS